MLQLCCSFFLFISIHVSSTAEAWFWANYPEHCIEGFYAFKSNLRLLLCCTPKRLTCLWSPSPGHCAQETQLLSKKMSQWGQPLAILCLIRLAQDMNLRPTAPVTSALPSYITKETVLVFESSCFLPTCLRHPVEAPHCLYPLLMLYVNQRSCEYQFL